MGQGESVPVESYVSLVEQYKKLQLDYDVVSDELYDVYADYDAARAALANKQRNMRELGVWGGCLY